MIDIVKFIILFSGHFILLTRYKISMPTPRKEHSDEQKSEKEKPP